MVPVNIWFYKSDEIILIWDFVFGRNSLIRSIKHGAINRPHQKAMLVNVYHYASKPFDVLSAFQIYRPFTIIYYRICTWMQSIQHTQITSCGRLPIRQYPLLYLVVLLLTIPVPLSTVQDILPTVQGS